MIESCTTASETREWMQARIDGEDKRMRVLEDAS